VQRLRSKQPQPSERPGEGGYTERFWGPSCRTALDIKYCHSLVIRRPLTDPATSSHGCLSIVSQGAGVSLQASRSICPRVASLHPSPRNPSWIRSENTGRANVEQRLALPPEKQLQPNAMHLTRPRSLEAAK
jgi:hypothetical protein